MDFFYFDKNINFKINFEIEGKCLALEIFSNRSEELAKLFKESSICETLNDFFDYCISDFLKIEVDFKRLTGEIDFDIATLGIFPSDKDMIMKMLLKHQAKESHGIICKGPVQAESAIIHPSIKKLTEMEKDGQISSVPTNRSPSNLTFDSKDSGR